jgi:hypothetical protein
MTIRTLKVSVVPATEKPEIWVDTFSGYSQILSRDGLIAADDQECYAQSTRFALSAAPLNGKLIAWIGGGLCIGPRLFALAECEQVVYEIEPLLAEFCPKGVKFIPGDWRDTISGTYDVIVYDLGGEVPRETLANFLAPGGVILPKED